MGKYHSWGQDTNTAATSLFSLSQPATALKRLKLGYLHLGSDATADNAYEGVIKRGTADGTFTAGVENPRDPADGTASAIAGFAHSVEPTYTSDSEQLAVFAHQRAAYQWYAAPGAEIIIPVTNDAMIAYITNTVVAAFNQGFSIEWEE